MKEAVCIASPSLALIKYWGKKDPILNTPATPSIAVTLDSLETRTIVRCVDGPDEVFLDGKKVRPSRYQAFFDNIKQLAGYSGGFSVESSNNFPTAAGLASSSSGFAALAGACVEALEYEISIEEISRLARLGSGSAARSVYGGFTRLGAGAEFAESLYPASYWPELRVIAVYVSEGPKSSSSRLSMEGVKQTSPFYDAWVADACAMEARARKALDEKNLPELGHIMRLSYLRMFGTMLAADPPVIYWHPDSVELISMAQEMRSAGIDVYETMDAGPQVKLITLEKDVDAIETVLKDQYPHLSYKISKAGQGLRWQTL